MGKSWYSIKAQADSDETEVVVYDEIGYWGVTAAQFIREFKSIPAQNSIKLRINSPGGDVFDGLAIYNVIARHEGKVTATIDGLAASAASVIAMAANQIVMPENAFMMIHDPWGVSIGNADELRDMAEVLDKIKAGLVSTYVNRSGQSAEKISELMSAETWLTAAEAKELGLADEVAPAMKVAASYSRGRFQNLPAGFTEQDDRGGVRAALQNDIAAIHAECAKAGVPEYAAELVGKGKTSAQVADLLKDAAEIRNICTASRLANRANDYIKSGMSLEEIRADLIEVAAKRDAIHEVDNKLPEPKKTGNAAPVDIDQRAIYAKRNGRK